jgi:hypothetical protein
MGILSNGKKMVIYEMNQRGPPWLFSENGIFFIYGYFWDLWEKWYLFYGFGIIFDGRCLWCSNV